MEAAIKRILPHSTEAEQAVVGAMLMDKDAIMVAAEMLTGEDFYQSAYGMLFDAMVELFQAGKPVDLITLQEHLKEKNAPPEISGLEFARELLVNAQTSANIKYYAEIVREKATLRADHQYFFGIRYSGKCRAGKLQCVQSRCDWADQICGKRTRIQRNYSQCSGSRIYQNRNDRSSF